MKKPITEQKCPACGAPLRFDPASGKLVCDYCGTVTDLQEQPAAPSAGTSENEQASAEEAESGKPSSAGGKDTGAAPTAAKKKKDMRPASQKQEDAENQAKPPEAGTGQKKDEDDIGGFDFLNMTDAASVPDAENLPVYNCVSCGAEVIAPAEQVALTCPYCGNNIVLTEKVSGKLRPDGVIPFKIQAKDLPDAVNRFYRDKKLLPPRFFSESTMGKVTGVYVPFWVFNGEVTGEVTYRAQTSASSRSGDYIITKTDHYRLVREAALSFEELPVDASGRIEDRLMDSLEPFDSGETRSFDMRYLAGFTADRFDQKKTDLSSRAKTRMQNTTLAVVDANAASDYGAATREHASLKANINAKYILFPVYLFDISHAGKNYSFAVNGQTGKVVGDIPTDAGVSMMYFLKRFGLVSGALIIYSIAKYMLGM